MIDVVIIRDPDYSNDITVFGDDEARIIDIDLGSMDLGDELEWDEWQQSRREDFESCRWKDAAKLIAQVVANTASDCGHPVPEWAS